MLKTIWYLPRYAGMFLIRIYQKTLSFDHGLPRHLFPNGYCRFHPSCSEYGYQCLRRHGLVKGSLLTLWRIIRCNPWSSGGSDPVPEK